MQTSTDSIKSNPLLPGELAAQDDVQLMLAIIGGSRDAFTELASRYLSQIVKFAYRYVGSRSDAEDIAQETLIRLWKHASSWEPQGFSLRSWIYRISYNLCIDEIRKRKPVVELKHENQAIASEEPENEVYVGQKNLMLSAALDALPERQRTAINLCVYQALSNQDAADTMGISVEALESLLSRARRNLRNDVMNQPGSGI